MPENTENYDLIVAAQEAVDPYLVSDPDGEPSGLYIVRDSHGEQRVIDLRDKLGLLPERPARKTGHVTVSVVESFIGSLHKHGLPETELYGNAKTGTIRAVINAHKGINDMGDAEDTAGHGDHAITLQLQHTPDWKDWTSRDGKLMGQADFAEFIEDHLPNFVDPTGADMLELAQTFQATTKVDFESSQRITSGETQLTYKEDTTAQAGKKGALAIPDTFAIGLQVFERGDAYKVQARFRYRINGGQLLLGYRLTRPDDVLRDAFDAVVTRVETDTVHSVWHQG
ncbi:DUF2303 family protein [Ornithinimicrobium sufpigmenti]|uniref:DUF2303 family protein n=1 Tax=Ornithinimicrobium sufpigmenti TaxID=2508882 RepID=UPI001036CBD7|nr:MULTISPECIES: DUF2303 family protein [unclassified Ornithinimicrobium]